MNRNDDQYMFLHERADYGKHFDSDTTSGKTDGNFSRNEKSLRYSRVFVISEFDTHKVEIQ